MGGYKRNQEVILNGPGENDGRMYHNVSAIIIETDPYYKDYHVRLKDGTEDWLLPKYIRRKYLRTEKRRKKK